MSSNKTLFLITHTIIDCTDYTDYNETSDPSYCFYQEHSELEYQMCYWHPFWLTGIHRTNRKTIKNTAFGLFGSKELAIEHLANHWIKNNKIYSIF